MLFGSKRTSNWDIVKNKQPKDTIKNRDVYANQQLERGSMPKPESKTSRVLLVTLFAIACGFAGYLVVGMFNYLSASFMAFGQGQSIPIMFYLMMPTKIKVLGFAAGFGICYGFIYPMAMRNLEAQNATSDYKDINQYQNDQHVALPEEVMRKFQPFPDAGAHSWIQPSSMISHVALTNKGINPVKLTRRFPDDMVFDENGDLITFKEAQKRGMDVSDADIVAYKGEAEYDENGDRIKDTYPMIDHDFMEALFDASDDPKDPQIRKYYDPTTIPYNPGGKLRDRLGAGDKNAPKSWADFINADWTIPDYETQRPAGAYVVDTDPVNTMVLAITRAGKGQTVINPTIDCWLREKRPNNIVINDPKGELLQSFYVPATYRGFRVVQFNLINVINTDIYNPLILAANAANEGDYTKCSTYVQNIADVFFPTEGQSDPFWPTAANNAFKRVAFGMIDYYYEEARAYTLRARAKGVDQAVIDTHLDRLWGKVTLYNCYQFFVRLSSKKIKNPTAELKAKDKSGELDKEVTDELADQGITPESPDFDMQKRDLINEKVDRANKKAEFWNDQPEIDELSLYFNATDVLPRNSMRDLVANANNSLKAMGGSDKTISSVYGIAITSMAFFTDPTISTLTSGTPSQNIDLAGASFPRRIGFRMASKYFADWHLLGQQAVWQAYSDPEFKKSMGPDFHHEGEINRTKWARFYFKGIFKTDTAFLKCTIRDMQTKMEITEFYFEFVKGYQTSLSGFTYIKDPVLGQKIVKDGTLYELRPVRDKKTGKVKYVRGHMTYKETQLVDISDAVHTDIVQLPVITQMSVNYTEKPMVIFMVTPPHLMAYAKIILILIKQLVDVSFDQSYMTKANQKPLYKTRFMLDELGNLQSSGHGIQGFQTMLSIGLG